MSNQADQRIDLLAALVHRKWRAWQEIEFNNAPDAAARERLLALKQERAQEWAAASLLLQLAQDAMPSDICPRCGKLAKYNREWKTVICLACGFGR